MMGIRPIAHSTALALALLVVAVSAEAQLTNPERRCIDGYHNKLRLIAQMKGRDVIACIKSYDKGELNAETVDHCVDSATKQKTMSALDKLSKLYLSDICTGSEPIQGGVYAGTAHVLGVTALTHDIFGTPLSEVPGPTAAKCKEQTISQTLAAYTEQVRSFRSCCKDRLGSGDIVDSASLQASQCMPTASATGDTKTGQKLLKAMEARCAGVARSSLFAGLVPTCPNISIDADEAWRCVVHRIDCRICQALNTTEGTSRDCDLFDDATANGSCV